MQTMESFKATSPIASFTNNSFSEICLISKKQETNPTSGRRDFAANPFQPSIAFHIETSHLI